DMAAMTTDRSWLNPMAVERAVRLLAHHAEVIGMICRIRMNARQQTGTAQRLQPVAIDPRRFEHLPDDGGECVMVTIQAFAQWLCGWPDFDSPTGQSPRPVLIVLAEPPVGCMFSTSHFPSASRHFSPATDGMDAWRKTGLLDPCWLYLSR